MPMKQIARRLGVSPGSVHLWTRDIAITESHRSRNARLARERFAVRWIEINRERRLGYQEEGRARARAGDPLHQAGCMLYWAEGGKDRSLLNFANSDRAMVSFFWRFLRHNFVFDPARVRVRLNVYLNNGLSLEEIEDRWIEGLRLPRVCFRSHVTSLPDLQQRQEAEQAPLRSLHPAALRHPNPAAHLRRDPGVRRVRGASLARRAAARKALGLSRRGAPAAPSARAGGSRPGPRPPSARRRARPP